MPITKKISEITDLDEMFVAATIYAAVCNAVKDPKFMVRYGLDMADEIQNIRDAWLKASGIGN